ncbi:hypothetical protein BKA62DRAFT_675362 [Auriculariales sp. MPI-PUGE-AT-0066]|nr:hypothetical protein BKA62DRAFT_675362 [Auriculariales sp. MPI-PUGE-AT-0066]
MSKPVSAAVPSITAQAISPLPDAVVQLCQSVVALDAAVETLCVRKSLSSEAKRDARLVAEIGKRLDSAIVSACAQRLGELHVLAKSHVSVARDAGTLRHVFMRSSIAIQVLEEMLEIKNGIAQLVLDPARRLGLSAAKPSCDLPNLTASRAFAEGFKVVVQGLANMTDGAPWLWKAIPQTMLQFTALVERALDQPKKIQDIADKIAQRIASLLDISQNNGGHNTELDNYVESFLADVQRIIVRLRIVERVRPLKAFPLTDYIENIITTEAKKMQDAYQELQARFIVHTAYTAQTIACAVAAIQGTAVQTLAVVVDTRTEVKAVGVMVTEIHAAVAGPSTKPLSQIPRERSFLQDRSFSKVVMTGSTRLWHHLQARCRGHRCNGTGGVGKTSLALAVLHVADCVAKLPLLARRARDTIQIAKAPSDVAERAALDILLGEVDCFPLAVTLLSTLALLQNSPSDLLRRWRKSRTKLLSSQAKHRTFNVDVSIRVSLDLLQPMTHGAEALQLLAICAHLPEGMRRPVYGKLAEHFSDVDGARDLLVEFALVTVGAEGELKMLSPIRYFVLENHPISDAHFVSLQQIYFDIAASAPQEPADDFTARSTQFAPEYGNLTSFLLHLINSEEPSEKLFDAVRAVSEYAYCTMPSPTLREALLLRLTTQTAWLAECLQGLGRTRLRRSEYSLAMDNLQAARILYAELGNRFQEAECRSILGACMRLQYLYDAAEVEQRAARDIFIELDCESNAARCVQRLGNICRRRGEDDQAIDHLTSARDTFKRHGKRLCAAQCTRSLGEIQLDQGNLSAAESDFQSALSEFEALGDQLGAAQCARLLGEVRRRQGDYDSAETLLTAALEAFTRVGSRSDVAHCHLSFGILYRDQDRTRDALASFERARDVYEALGRQGKVAECNSQIQNPPKLAMT